MRAEIYFRFLMRAHALHIKSTWGELDPVEQKLLEFVAVASLEERVLQVKDLTSLHDLGSPAMLHARLHVMCEAGCICCPLMMRVANRLPLARRRGDPLISSETAFLQP